MWYLAGLLISIWLIGFWPTLILVAIIFAWAANDETDWFGSISEKLDPLRAKLGLKTRAQKIADNCKAEAMGFRLLDHMEKNGKSLEPLFRNMESDSPERKKTSTKPSALKQAAAFGIGAVAGYKAVRGSEKGAKLTGAERGNIAAKERQLRSQINSAQSTINFCTFNLTQNRGPKKDAEYRAKIASETARLSTLNAELARLPRV